MADEKGHYRAQGRLRAFRTPVARAPRLGEIELWVSRSGADRAACVVHEGKGRTPAAYGRATRLCPTGSGRCVD